MKEDKILIRNVIDKYNKYKKTLISTSTNFLNEQELKKVTKELDKMKIKYSIYSPYEFLEKKIIYFGECKDFISYYKGNINDKITHPKILGALFSLGIDNDLIGDIFIEKDCFYITNLTRMNSFLEMNFNKIGKENIKLEKVNDINLKEPHTLEFNILVSSMRLDNVVSKITNLSRSSTLDLINNKKVLLNYEEKSSKTILNENDIISIRKYGKYKIGNIKGKTKKENLVLNIIKFI